MTTGRINQVDTRRSFAFSFAAAAGRERDSCRQAGTSCVRAAAAAAARPAASWDWSTTSSGFAVSLSLLEPLEPLQPHFNLGLCPLQSSHCDHSVLSVALSIPSPHPTGW